MDTALLDLAGLQGLVDVLVADGYTVLGPTVRQGAVVHAPITSVEQLPRGWADAQDAGEYRLRRRDDDALFGFANGPAAAKPVFFPTEQLLWRARGDGSQVDAAGAASAATGPPYAVLGLRSCDLHALGIHDTVLAGRGYVDAHYAAAREDSFVVAVTCSDPGGTCFCVSMGTGPKPEQGRGAPFDLSLTELLDDGPHRFVVEVGSERGAAAVARVAAAVPTAGDLAAAETVARVAAGRMGRTLDTRGIKDLLYDNADSPQWDDVATRCLSCGNCTAVCPTCFCTTVEDVTDLAGEETERSRVWDSCFNTDFSYIHGGVVRESTRSRYRQWMTHKLGSWIDQFGMSGCVGCGRCISWCPAAIDITAEAAAIRDLAAADPEG